MLTIDQIRAARALLDWSQQDLAEHADLSQTGIARIENGTNKPNSKTIAKIEAAFDRANIEFIGTSGLRKRTGEIIKYSGQQGFRDFMDDVYKVAQEEGGEICLHNAKPDNWYKWLGNEWYEEHSKRMSELGETIDVKITAEKGNLNFIANSFAEYRWMPDELFNEQSFYAYGDRLALMSFKEDDVEILVIKNRQFKEGFVGLFNVAWKEAAIKTKSE